MGIVAAAANLTIQAGSTWTQTFVCTYKTAGSWGAAGAPVDFTGWSARMQVRASLQAATPLLAADSTSAAPAPRMSVDGAAGKVSLTVEAVDTSPLCPTNKPTNLTWGVEMFQNLAGVEQVMPLLQGTLTVMPEVVR